MPRLKHVTTGAVVNVDDETAAQLGSEWQPAKTEPKKAAAKAPEKK